MDLLEREADLELPDEAEDEAAPTGKRQDEKGRAWQTDFVRTPGT
jgi:hypothetical protein